MKLHRLSTFVGAAVGALAVVVATSFGPLVSTIGARSPSAEEQVVALQQDLHALQSAAQKAQVMAVTYQLDTSGFHDMDVKAHAGELVPGALGKTRRARIAMEATSWPPELQARAGEVTSHMHHLEAALRNENSAEVAPHAKAVHDIGHDLSAEVYVWLSGAQPAEHQHGQSQPGAQQSQ